MSLIVALMRNADRGISTGELYKAWS